MIGQKPSFTAHREITNLELPKGTVIEIELVTERVGEVCQWATCVSHKSSVLTGSCPAMPELCLYITDVLAVHEEVFISKPMKERYVCMWNM